MSYHKTEIISDFPADKLFELVLDIESYPIFLPWCKSAKILKRKNNIIIADLVIEFKNICESYTSKVIFNRSDSIDVEMIEGPFKFLLNKWRFSQTDDGKTLLYFEIDFQFNSIILEALIGIFFDRAVEKLACAFLQRADILFK